MFFRASVFFSFDLVSCEDRDKGGKEFPSLSFTKTVCEVEVETSRVRKGDVKETEERKKGPRQDEVLKQLLMET